MRGEKLETVKVEKDGETVTINKSDAAAWAKDGWKAVKGSESKPAEDEKADGYHLVQRSRGKWDVVKFVDGKETDEVLTDEPVTKAEAEEVLEAAKAE